MKIQNIIVHCSDSPKGTAKDIDAWHKARGFRKIGYHYVIRNDFPGLAGLVEKGRRDDEVGAHTLGFNTTSLGICLIGKKGHFTNSQLRSLYALLTGLCKTHQLTPDDILGHYETENGRSQGKTCPDLDMDAVRREVKERLP